MNPVRHEHPHPSGALDAAPSDDVAVVRRIASGDETALAALFDRWAPLVYSLVVRILRDADSAEDVVEETFWEAWQHAGSYDPACCTVRAWLLTLGRSRAIVRLRADHGRRARDVTEDAIAEADREMEMREMAPAAERVARALDTLPAEQRRVLRLAYFHALTQAEIAKLLRVPLGVVKGDMRAALRGLRDALAGSAPAAQPETRGEART